MKIQRFYCMENEVDKFIPNHLIKQGWKVMGILPSTGLALLIIGYKDDV